MLRFIFETKIALQEEIDLTFCEARSLQSSYGTKHYTKLVRTRVNKFRIYSWKRFSHETIVHCLAV